MCMCWLFTHDALDLPLLPGQMKFVLPFISATKFVTEARVILTLANAIVQPISVSNPLTV